MATVEPSSAPTLPPTSGPDGTSAQGGVNTASLEYTTGVKNGKVEGYWQGRKDAWNSLLICLGHSLGAGITCDRREIGIYLKCMECFLEVEKLTYPNLANLKIKVDEAKANIAKCGLEPEIQKLVQTHWKGP